MVDGHTMLHHAAWIGDTELVEVLLECGADPNAVDPEHGHADATADARRVRRRT
jgi:ankyrin repeat protein